MHYFIPDLSYIDAIAMKFFYDWHEHKIFAFHGSLGSGKTTFISAVLKVMNVSDLQGSPTYPIINTYESLQYGTIYHADCYRLNNEQEAYDIGLDELLYESTSFVFIEWPEKIFSLLPPQTVHLTISVNASKERTLSIDNK